MTARGQLFIDEDCRDHFAEEFGKVFGKDKWQLDASKYGHYYNEVELPGLVVVPIINPDTNEIIGRADIQIQFNIYDDTIEGKVIEAEPKSLIITKVKSEDKICMQCLPHHSKALHTRKGCCIPGCGCPMVSFDGV
jgi:hypothetical protein